MNIKQIEKTTEYQNDRSQCTVVASSVAFNMDYKKIHQFYLDNGRKLYRGLIPFYTNKIIYKLADLEGYKVTFFRPSKKHGLRKWVSGADVWNNGHRYYADFEPDNKEILCRINKHLTPNNLSQWRIEKTSQKSKSQKVKRLTFDDIYSDIMNFEF